MQLSKTLTSYLSGALLLLAAIIQAIHMLTDCVATAIQACPAPDPVVAKILAILGVIVLVVRNVITDFGNSSNPVVSAAANAGAAAGADAARKMTLALFLVIGLAGALLACTPKPGFASPPTKNAITFASHRGPLSAPDTLVGTFACTAAAPTTACGVNASAAGGTVDAAHSDTSVAVGSTGTIRIICSAPGTSVTFTGSLFGTAPGYSNSPPTATVTVPLSCPTKAASTPGAFVITFGPPHSGG